MKSLKFIMAGGIILGAIQNVQATTNESLIINSREIFGNIEIFNIPSTFTAEPGNVYETSTFYKFDKKDPSGNILETVIIRATRDDMIPKNHSSFISDAVINSQKSCPDSFSTFSLPESEVMGVTATSTVFKCGSSGGLFRRKPQSVTIAIRAFMKNDVFYEITWNKYGSPTTEPLTNTDKEYAERFLNTITPYAECKSNENTIKDMNLCLKKFGYGN